MFRLDKIIDIVIVLFIFLILFIFTFPPMALSSDVQPESWYRDKWCKGFGEIEVPVENISNPPKCDCVTKNFAVEIDFGYKWYEGFTQAQFYATRLNKLPGLLIVMKSEKDIIYIERLFDTIKEQKLSIRIWIVDAKGNPVDIR